MPEKMDHNTLDVMTDFVAPLAEFLDTFGIETNNPVYD